MSNMKNNKSYRHVISYYWRGDVEETERWTFPTKEDAWKFVVKSINERKRNFREDEADHDKTVIDWETLFSDLFEGGSAEVTYCQCSAWWDNWFYHMEEC